ncbi:hypothetical protein [Anabaena sp. 54]|uniref:hypothetical protein n=1 Tax=Anabaena sp. 54 TaxID=46231 RepID=UPI0025BCB219|nr:hypothetical protein [Anabaena sp. 54]MBO1067177.1 hypothetical protein [Anabaena sp. 54]
MEFQETNNSQPETKEQVEQFPKEKKIELIDQAKNTLKSMLSMSRTNEKIYNKLLLVYNWLCAIYDGQPDTQFEYSEIKVSICQTKYSNSLRWNKRSPPASCIDR